MISAAKHSLYFPARWKTILLFYWFPWTPQVTPYLFPFLAALLPSTELASAVASEPRLSSAILFVLVIDAYGKSNGPLIIFDA